VLRVIWSTCSEIVGLRRFVCSVQLSTMLFRAASHALGADYRTVSLCMVVLSHFATRLANGGFALVNGFVLGLLKDRGYIQCVDRCRSAGLRILAVPALQQSVGLRF
jgi:hypothetical protein